MHAEGERQVLFEEVLVKTVNPPLLIAPLHRGVDPEGLALLADQALRLGLLGHDGWQEEAAVAEVRLESLHPVSL